MAAMSFTKKNSGFLFHLLSPAILEKSIEPEDPDETVIQKHFCIFVKHFAAFYQMNIKHFRFRQNKINASRKSLSEPSGG